MKLILLAALVTFIVPGLLFGQSPKLFLLTSLTYVPPSHGASSTMRCLIEPKSVKGALKKSTAVFSGDVLEIRSGVNFLQARFRVERSWKGVEAEQVSVLTENTAESPHYRVGEKYLVFAGIRDGKLFTSSPYF